MKAIADNFTKYTPGNGILELRQEIVKKLREDNGVEYALNEVTTAVGAKQAIASAMMVLAGPGDEVLLPLPCWVSYTEMIRLAGATPVFVPVREDNYELDLDAIEKAITPRTKAIVICTPNNPTGAVYSEESLRKLAALAVEHDFFVVADEIYEKLVYGGEKHISIASLPGMKERTITLNGFSKCYSMTGWRLGYAAAPVEFIKAMVRVHQYINTCAASFVQEAGITALEKAEPDVQEMVKEYARRRDYMVSAINSMDGVSCKTPGGAFYVFMNIKSFGMSSADMANYLLEEAKIATVPGSAFGSQGEGYVRFSYACSYERIVEGMERMRKALAKLPKKA